MTQLYIPLELTKAKDTSISLCVSSCTSAHTQSSGYRMSGYPIVVGLKHELLFLRFNMTDNRLCCQVRRKKERKDTRPIDQSRALLSDKLQTIKKKSLRQCNVTTHGKPCESRKNKCQVRAGKTNALIDASFT